MGFYGNVAASNKTSYEFDIIYNTRKKMDESAQSDGVFLGRYVLIEYDGTHPIQGYYNPETKKFYNDPHFDPASVLAGEENALYQDIHQLNNGRYNFYLYDAKTKVWNIIEVAAKEPYAANYWIDIQKYGRGYDSTAWIKRFNTNTNAYEYVMVAELNTVTPNFHLSVEPPSNLIVTPYFDKNATNNLDYYFYIQPQFNNRIKEADADVSDEQTTDFEVVDWKYDDNFNESFVRTSRNANLDIFYNKAGFDRAIRTYRDDVENGINYDMSSSSRIYRNHIGLGARAEDTKDWYFRLPVLGNTICELWDKTYGFNENQERYLEFAQKENDSAEHLVTYDKTTTQGLLNNILDLMGHQFIEKTDDLPEHVNISNHEIKRTHTYEEAGKTDEVMYRTIDTLYYTIGENGAIDKYYFYAYNPIFNPVAGDSLEEGVDYFYLDNSGNYRLANPVLYGALDRNNEKIGEVYTTYYTIEDRWTLTQLDNILPEDTLHGLILKLHKLIGTGDPDTRDISTIKGGINRIADIISHIDLKLSPGKLIHTNDQGVIETTDTYYPSSNDDATRVLVGIPGENGSWENRVRSIRVDDRDTSEENWLEVSDTIDTNVNNNNEIAFQGGNKWIGLEIQKDNNQKILIKHMASNQEAHDFMSDIDIAPALKGTETAQEDTSVIQKDNIFTFPMVKTDNAGHVVDYELNSIYIPHTFQSITVDTQDESSSNSNSVQTNGTIRADHIIDDWKLSSQNKWLRIAANVENDRITIGHSLPEDGFRAHEFKTDVVRHVGIDGTQNEDCIFTIPLLKTDDAGHVIGYDTMSIYIPYNYRNIKLAEQSVSKEAMTSNNGLQEADLTNDTFTFGTGNKWIVARTDDDSITFAHELSAQAEHNFANDLDVSEGAKVDHQNDNVITFPLVETDNAGHIIKYSTHQFSIPHGFKNIKIVEDTDSNTENGTFDTEALFSAAASDDQLTFTPQNKWINMSANIPTKTVSVGHLLSPLTTHVNDGDRKAKEPLFGETFTVPEYKVDKAGHIIESTSHTVKVPQNSYVQTENANVMTSMTLNKDTGAFNATRVHVGTLALTEYSASDNAEQLAATDTINSAFAKTQKQINNEAAARENAITNLTTDLRTTEEKLNAMDTTITNNLNQEISNREAAVSQALKDANKYTDAAVAGLVDSAPDTLNTLNELAAALGQNENFATTVAQQIGEVNTKVDNTQNNLTAHENRTDNPHNVTREQLQVNNVTNESKETMFTNPTFTGVASAVTPSTDDNSTRIATTEFVNSKIDILVQQAVNAAMEDLLKNCEISLVPHTVSLSSLDNGDGTATINAAITSSQLAGDISYRWLKKQEDDTFVVIEGAEQSTLTVTESGTYSCVVLRMYHGMSKEVNAVIDVEIVPVENDAPEQTV